MWSVCLRFSFSSQNLLCGVFKPVCETIKVISAPSKWDIITLGVIGCEEKCQYISALLLCLCNNDWYSACQVGFTLTQ
jgi:hypothetical protein